MRPLHGGHPDPTVLDFSTSLNPLGPPLAVRRVLECADALSRRYPSPDADALCAAAAKRHGIPEQAVLAGNGSAELIYLVAQSLAGRRAWVAQPAFAEYAAACRAMDVALSCAERAYARFLANPTSPRGTLLPGAQLVDQPGLRVIDEAFMGFTDERESVVARAARDPGVIVLRSLTKLYALPGLRAGYLVAHPETVRALRRRQPPWSVNALAQAAGVAALADEEYARRTPGAVRALREALRQGLGALGLAPEPSEASYVLCRVRSATRLCAALLRRGIAARDCSSFEELEPDRHVRFAVRTAAENQRLLATLAEIDP